MPLRLRALPFAVLLTTACAARQPIATLSASTDGVTLSYPTGSSYATVSERADAVCATYGKRARPSLAPTQTNDEHWSVATFYCLPK